MKTEATTAGGCTLYRQRKDDRDVIVDIDVNPGTTTVDFVLDREDPNLNLDIRLKEVQKQFSDVTTLVIHDYTWEISISNFMFPNVRKVIFRGITGTETRSCLIRNGILLNTFCRKSSEVIDMSDVRYLAKRSMEGCSAGLGDLKHDYSVSELVRSGYSGTVNPEPYDGPDLYSCICYPEYRDGKVLMYLNYRDLRCNPTGLENCINSIDADELILSDNPFFIVRDNVIYSHDGKRLIRCPAGRTGDFTVPEGVEVIEKNAFSCKITSVTMPSTLRKIDMFSFRNCKNLEKVTLNEGLEEIGCYAFSESEKVKEITFPKSLKKLAEMIFPSLEKVLVKGDSWPVNFLEAVTRDPEVYRLNEKDLRTVECRMEKGETLFVPLYRKSLLDRLDHRMNSTSPEELNALYRYAGSNNCRYICALRSYLVHHDDATGRYLKMTSRSVLEMLFKFDLESELIEYIETDLVPEKNLRTALELARSRNMVRVIACIVAKLGKQEKSGNSFAL